MVLDREVNRNFIEGLEAVSPDFRAAILDLNQSPAGLALDISDALKRGEWVTFMSDRYRNTDRTEVLDFLGSPALFPVGPIIIAGMFKVPLISVFPLYVDGRYELYCEVLSASVELPRASRQVALREYIGLYVAQLEKHVRMGPYNWFNFYSFWKRHD